LEFESLDTSFYSYLDITHADPYNVGRFPG
jgi:hypothetical protein